jgi:hypothetical protein
MQCGCHKVGAMIHFHEFKGFVEIRLPPHHLVQRDISRRAENTIAKCGVR